MYLCWRSCKSTSKVAIEGKLGETYNIWGDNEKKNIEVVNQFWDIAEMAPNKPAGVNLYKDLMACWW